MIILTSGPRDYALEAVIHERMGQALELVWHLCETGLVPKFINGGARGCDSFVRQWCLENEYAYEAYKPEYQFSGDKEAPLRRNEQMARMCGFGIIFWSGCEGQYKGGTLHTMNCLARAGKRFVVFPLDHQNNRISEVLPQPEKEKL